VTADTPFNIASVTKPMTVVLAIGEIEARHMALRDSIARWMPEFPHADSITIGQLLRHRSGIPHQGIPDSEMTRAYTSAEVVSRLAALPLDFPPGTQFHYSSGGFEVLARVLELSAGKDYGDLLEERIFGPLGMSRSWHSGAAPRPGQADHYVPGPSGLERAPQQNFSALIGAGSVWSTARDLHRFVEAVVGGRFGEPVRTGLAGGGHLDFNGRTGGFKAYAVWDSTSGVEYEFLGNVATGAPDALKSALPHLALGERVDPPSLPALRERGFSDQEVRNLSGVYRLANGVRLDVHAARGALWCNDWPLVPTRDGRVFSPQDYGLIRPVAAEGGRVTRLEWIQDGTTYPAPRDSTP
jgi:CubicO group peptidase (beta-lactamase class C family)